MRQTAAFGNPQTLQKLSAAKECQRAQRHLATRARRNCCSVRPVAGSFLVDYMAFPKIIPKQQIGFVRLPDSGKWYRKAAEQDVATAQCDIGSCYYLGDGVPKDYLEAYRWLNLASAQGFETAKKILSIIEQQMTQEQISEAQQLAREFKPRKAAWENSSMSNANSNSNPKFSGTGFFITGDGYLISNYHVVEEATKVCLLTSAGLIDAKVVQVDAANDLALLKADGGFRRCPLPPVAR